MGKDQLVVRRPRLIWLPAIEAPIQKVRRRRQAMGAVDSVGVLDVDRPALDAQAAVQHPVAVAAVLAGEVLQVLAQPAVAIVTGLVAQGAGALAHQPQSLAFAQTSFLQLPHDLAARRHGHYFPLSTSRIASISSMELASGFFSFVLSASSAFSRWASDTFMPPNLAFQA